LKNQASQDKDRYRRPLNFRDTNGYTAPGPYFCDSGLSINLSPLYLPQSSDQLVNFTVGTCWGRSNARNLQWQIPGAGLTNERMAAVNRIGAGTLEIQSRQSNALKRRLSLKPNSIGRPRHVPKSHAGSDAISEYESRFRFKVMVQYVPRHANRYKMQTRRIRILPAIQHGAYSS